MIRRFTTMSIVVLALLIVAARAIGSANKPLAFAMLDPGDCPQPCWHGIRPGVTTVEEARAILAADSSITLIDATQASIMEMEGWRICWHMKTPAGWRGCIFSDRGSTERVAYLALRLPQGAMQLGEAIKWRGEPISISACPYIDKITSTVPYPYWSVNAQFMGHTSISAYASLNLEKDTSVHYIIDPSMIVHDVWYASSVSEEDVDAQKWRGFTQIKTRENGCGAIFMP